MFAAEEIAFPPGALLATYEGQPGTYTDCYFIDVPGEPDFERYVALFFDTWLFRIEQSILTAAGKGPATREDVLALATGQADHFAAWETEARTDDQLLLTAGNGVIRTWLQIAPSGDPATPTRLLFGSAVLPVTDADGSPRSSRLAALAMPFHKVYARALLGAAARAWGTGT